MIPSLLVSCRVCTHPVTLESFPLCPGCLRSLMRAPDLCPNCGQIDCLSVNPGACLRPWAPRTSESDPLSSPAPLLSFHAAYLLIGHGYEVLKRWKTNLSPLFNQRVVNPAAREITKRLPPVDVIVPVPQSFDRRWQLKGSPPRVWAEALASELKHPVQEHLTVGASLHTKRQAERTLEERAAAQLSFTFRKPSLLADRHVLLVDDFMTTGKTLRSAARALLPLRPASVHACVLGVRPRRTSEQAAPHPAELAHPESA